MRTPVVLKTILPLEKTDVGFDNMQDFHYSKIGNLNRLVNEYADGFYGFIPDIMKSTLKLYQEMLILAFISQNVPRHSKILDIGGGLSRILLAIEDDYDCWLIDEFLGVANGPEGVPELVQKSSINVVQNAMGAFDKRLDDDSFDFVFSISALEHLPHDGTLTKDVIKDIDRVLKPGGYSLHCLDTIIQLGSPRLNRNVQCFLEKMNSTLTVQDIIQDRETFCLPKNIYERWNLELPYEEVIVCDIAAFWMG